MTPLIHGERDPLLDCRPVVQVPAPLTRDEADLTLKVAAAEKAKALVDADLIDDLARDLAEAWVRMESWGHALNVPDADFIDLARKTIERVRAAA